MPTIVEQAPTSDKKATFCEALAHMEGWLIYNSRARRNHNPGNINWGRFAMMHGATKIEEPSYNNETPRFAFFPNDSTGFEAMSSLLEGHYLGLTVKQAIYRWAPPTENNSDAYCANVCKWTGLTPETILTSAHLAPPLKSSSIIGVAD